MRRSSRRAALVLLTALASPAHAHMMTTGFGPFYDGLAHVLLTPEDLLPVIALALLAGLRGAYAGRLALFALPAAWLAASVAGTLGTPPAAPLALTAAMLVGLGALVAADAPVPPAAVAGIALGIGLLGGALNGVALATASALVTLGAASALFTIVALVGGQIVSLRAPWARIVVRVGGSWIVAIGLLMLGWSLRAA